MTRPMKSSCSFALIWICIQYSGAVPCCALALLTVESPFGKYSLYDWIMLSRYVVIAASQIMERNRVSLCRSRHLGFQSRYFGKRGKMKKDNGRGYSNMEIKRKRSIWMLWPAIGCIFPVTSSTEVEMDLGKPPPAPVPSLFLPSFGTRFGPVG